MCLHVDVKHGQVYNHVMTSEPNQGINNKIIIIYF